MSNQDLYIKENVIKVNNLYYEKLYFDARLDESEETMMKYRFVDDLDSDNYDYIEDEKMIELLDFLFENRKALNL